MADEKKMLSGFTSNWKGNPRFRLSILFTAGVLGVTMVVAGMAYRNSNNRTIQGQANLPGASVRPGNALERGETVAANERLAELVKKRDDERAAAAANDVQQTVLPSVPGLPRLTDPKTPPPEETVKNRNPLTTQPAAQPQPPAQGQATGQAPQAGGRPTDYNVRNTEAYKSSQKILNGVMERSLSAGTAPLVAITSGDKSAGGVVATPTVAGASVAAAPSTSASNTPYGIPVKAKTNRPLVRIGDAFFGTVDTAINTDYPGPIVATIREGPLAGARLTGSKELAYDAVLIKFTMLSPKDGGRMVPITAYAITADDAKSFGTTGIGGDVDYHIFQRYLVPATMAFIQAFGYASSIPEQTVTNGAYGSTVTQAPLTTSQKLWTAAGGAMQPLRKDMDRLAARPITIKLPANTEIGILFGTDLWGPGQNPDAAPPSYTTATAPAAGGAYVAPGQGAAGVPVVAIGNGTTAAVNPSATNVAAPSAGATSAGLAAPPGMGGVVLPTAGGNLMPTMPSSLLPSPFPQNAANPYGQTGNPYYNTNAHP